MDRRVRVVSSWSNGILASAVAGFAKQFTECLLLLPSRLAGEEMAHYLPIVAGVHALTVVELAAELARPLMAARGLGPLSLLGREAVAARIIHAAHSDGELKYFGPVARSPGFARALARTLGDLRMTGVSASDLADASAPAADLSRLLRRYEAELAERRMTDVAGVLALAAEVAIASPHRFLGLPLAMLDAPLEAPLHRALLMAVAARAPGVLAAVSSNDAHTASILGVAAEDLDNAAPNNSLEHLRRFLFSTESAGPAPADGRFQIFSAPGEGLEAAEIARRILRLARSGTRFDQVAIFLRNPERYQPMIEEALRRARIPAFFSRGTARPEPAGRAFLALLACAAEHLSASRFAEYLSLGQVPAPDNAPRSEWVAAEPESSEAVIGQMPLFQTESREPDRPPRSLSGWEKLLVDAAVINGDDRWKRRLAGLRTELDLQRAYAERTEPERVPSLARRLESLADLEHFAIPVIETLAAFPVEASWSEWREHLESLARQALRDPEPVLAVLAEFEPMGEVGPASLEEVFEVLSDRLRFLRREPPKRRWGRVFVGPVEEARGCEFAVVFLPGLAEGLFPRRALEDPLLLDDHRKALNKALQSALPLREHKVDQERMRLHVAVGAAREAFVASYSRMDVSEARPRVPSFYALELPRAVEGTLPALKDFEKLARDAAPARLNRPAPLDASDAIDNAEYDLVALEAAMVKLENGSPGGARYLVEANSHLARALRARWWRWEKTAWKEADGLITADRAALEALAEHQLKSRSWSPSALERFAICPYRFALAGIYGLRPREEAVPLEQIDPLTRGSLFHAVQFSLLRELQADNLLPVCAESLDVVLKRADAALKRVAGDYEEQLAPAIPRVWQSAIEDLRTDLRGWLQNAAQNDDDWLPEHFELGFGLENRGASHDDRDPASVPAPVALPEGVQLRGSIDLVERHLAKDVLRITDHKTGRPLEKIPLYTGGGKTLQPLLYALTASQLTGKPVESGRLFYATQRGGYQQMAVMVNDRARGFLTQFLADVDASIAGGFLPPVPEKEACGYCDYRVVCGPYEEQRVAKKDRRDERLEALVEIRSMG